MKKAREVSTGIEALSLFTKLVNPSYFVEATRESGYKGTTHALAELVDNAIQAKSTQIHILFTDEDRDSADLQVYVLDDGAGMDVDELSLALQFGGSTRFGTRDGLGRFGMGLPNASVSQCRRTEIYTRKTGSDLLYTYLDLDEVGAGKTSTTGFLVPIIVSECALPQELKKLQFSSGTLIVWRMCDRLTPRNIDGLKKKVVGFVGQAFRNFIYPVQDGKPARLITVNGTVVRPFDPLYLDPRAEWNGAEDRGTTHYDIAIPGRKTETSRVTVRYSMLPLEEWQGLAQKDKIARRITANRGFSIVRAGREIEVTDRYFLVGQNGQEGRIMNNDAWWGCEISFDPNLDEVFGVTHTKQEIHPNVQILQRLREDMSVIISTLRSEYEERRPKKTPSRSVPAEEIAAKNDQFLPPAPDTVQKPDEYQKNLDEYLERTGREGESTDSARSRVQTKLFTLEMESAKEGPFYRTAYLGTNTIVYVNTDHPFYTDLYAGLEDNPDAQVTVELLLFALARGERSSGPEGKIWYQSQRSVWTAALRAYLNK